MDEELKKIVQNMINAGESEANIALVIRSYKPTTVKKKDTPLSTAPKESMELEQKVGSSDSQKPKGFPEIDTNGILPDFDKMKSVKSPIPAKPKEDEVESFGGALVNRLDAGISRVSKSIYDIPSMLYDLGTQITNPAMTAVSNATGKSPSEILAKELNFENIPSKMMEEKIKESDAKIANYKKEIGGDIMTSYNKGDYINTFKHAALNSMESVPLIGLAMATGGESAIANLAIGTSTASTQYDQLSKEHPELETKDKLKNAAISGISEVIVGKFIEGVSGNVWKSLLANKGTKEGAKIATNSFKKSVEKAVGKSPILAGVGEYAEERIVDAIQQYSDINTGIKQEFDWEQNKGAGLSSLGFSAPNVVGMYGVKGYVNNQTKNQVKKANNAVLSLQKDLENPNLSEEQKATINTSIKDIYAKNKNILGAELKKFQAIPENEKVELLKIDEDIDELKSQAIEIKHSNDISEESKAVLLDNLKSKALKANNRKEEILSKSTKINFGELPLKEQETIKKKAMESLVTELNPDGKKDMTITDQMVTKRANEIYSESNLNEKENAKIEVPTPETKSEAEVKEQPKAETKVDGGNSVGEDVVKPTFENVPILTRTAEEIETAKNEIFDNLNKLEVGSVIENSDGEIKVVTEKITDRKGNQLIGIVTYERQEDGSLRELTNPVFASKSADGKIKLDYNPHTTGTNSKRERVTVTDQITGKKIDLSKENIFTTDENGNLIQINKVEQSLKEQPKADKVATPPVEDVVAPSVEQEVVETAQVETPEISPLEKAKQARLEAKAKLDAKRNATKEEVADKTPNIDNVENFINQTYSNNGNEPTTEANKGTKIDSVQENSGINKSEGKEQLTTKKKRAGNRTPLDKRQIKDPIMLSALKAEPFSATDLVQQYIIGGGRLTPDALNEVIATKNSKSSDVKARMSYLRTTQKGGKSFWRTIDSLMEKADELGISEDDIRNALIDVIHSHHSPKSMANDFVSRNGVFEKNKNGEVVNESGEVLVETPYGLLTNEQIKDLEAYEEANKDFGLNKEEFQEALSSLDQLTDAEIIELAENQEKSFKEYLEDLEKRQVTFDWYAFSGETGTIQPDGSIINDKGEYFSKEEVSNVKQLYPESKVEIKKPISKDTPELKEVNEKLEKANEKLRIAKDALDRKAKALDKELVRDNEDIFGERKNQNENKLFDERVDVNARNKATEKERKAITDAQNEIKSLKEAKAKIENKEITPTSEIDFNVVVVEKQIKEQPKSEKSKVESAKESLKEATAKRKETKAKLDAKKRNQGIANDPKQDAQDLYDYHQALVVEAKEYIKLGIATLSEFADALGEKVSISVKQAWDEAKGIISPITKGEDLSYDFTSMNNEVKEVKETPKKEQKQAEKPKVAPKKEVVEETVTKKAKDLGITDNQYEGLRDKAKALPQSGEFSEYLSGETIEDVYDDKARNEQGYEVTKLQQLTDHGVAFLDKAKDLFGGDYVAKTLDFLHNSNLNTFEKGVIYASLVNEMDTLNKNFPDDMEFKKLQDAVYADYQANLRVGSLTINTGRLIRILNAIKTGVEVATFTSKLYSPQQKEARTILENAVPTPERLNVVTENEKLYTQEELDTEIQKAKDKETFERLKRQVRKETRVGKKENLANEKAKIINELRALARKQLGKLSANPIPLDAIPLMYKLAKVSIKQGALTVEEVVDDVYNSLKDIYQNINKNDVKFVLENEPAEVEKDFKQPKLQEVVKQALIDAGFSRDIRNNKTGEVRQVIDWTKLFGRAGTIESLKTKVEEQLKAQGKTDAEIAEIQTQLYEEYKRLSELIVDKAIADLERRNLVKPSPHRKSNAKRLADLYEQGLFDANLDKYENIVNAILGFSKTSQETFDKIKEQVKALSDLYAEQSDGRVLSELEITTQSNKIKRAINVLFFNSVMKEAPTHAKIALANLQFGLWSLRSLLGSIKTLSENRLSGELQVRLSDLAFGRSSTKELRELNRRAKKMVSRDIRLYGAQPYGDTSMSLLAHSIIDDVINQKITTKTGHQLYNIISLRTFLDAVDSSVKVRLTNKHFVENAVNILMTNSDTRKAMTRKEALQFVSEALTGDNFKKAEETAKSVIDDVNAKAGKKVLKDNPEAIFRFAMDIVTKNLNSGEIMTMHEIEASFKAGVKSAGASIGHEANNIATVAVNSASQRLSKQLDKAITEQNWKTASVLAITSLIVKTTAMAFKGGGANWLVLNADKRIPLFGVGHALVRYKWDKNYKIDLDTETGRKGLEQSLYLQGQYRDTMMRGIYATGMFMVAAAAMGYKGDDEESNAEEFAKWLNKTENKWLKKYFYKIAPQSFSAFVAYESGLKEMPEYFGRMFDVGNEYYDKSVQLKRSLGSKQEGSTKEVLGQLSTAPFNAPLPWKAVKDIEEISRGLQGLKPIREEKSKKGFVKGMFKGGGIEYLGGLGKRLFGEKKEDKKTPN